MAGRDLSMLFSVCGECHLAATFTVTGLKRPPAERIEMATALLPAARSTAKHKPRRKKHRRKLVPRVLHCGTYRVA